MKLLLLLVINMSLILAMDYTPPNPIPDILQEKIKRTEELSNIDVTQEGRQHKRHSREHTTIDIHASITSPDGQETKLDIQKDGTLTQSADSDEKKTTYTRNFVIGTNCVSVVCTALIGAGVTLAVKFVECPK